MTLIKSENNISKKIKDLTDLYEEGVLTEEEFVKAKRNF